MHLVSFVCLRTWRCLTEKVLGLGQRRGAPPPPPLQPPKLSHTLGGHTLAGSGPHDVLQGQVDNISFLCVVSKHNSRGSSNPSSSSSSPSRSYSSPPPPPSTTTNPEGVRFLLASTQAWMGVEETIRGQLAPVEGLVRFQLQAKSPNTLFTRISRAATPRPV